MSTKGFILSSFPMAVYFDKASPDWLWEPPILLHSVCWGPLFRS